MNTLFACWLLKIRVFFFQSMLLVAIVGPNILFAQSFGEALSAYLSGKTDDALDQMRTLADGGNVDALLFLAENAQFTILPRALTDLSVESYERAAQQGSSHAQRRLGDIFTQRALGTDELDARLSFFERARNWYQQAAALGNAQAALALGRLLRNGEGGEADLEAALPFFFQAAEAGLPGADSELGLLLIQKNNFAEAISWIKSAAEADDPHAQALLSNLYLLGVAVEQSDELSLLWLERAATSGDYTAQRDLAGRYWSGVGVQKDRQEAVSLLQSASIGGNALAQITLGSMHYVGLEVELNYDLARDYFVAAADTGSLEAQYYLARMVQLAQGDESLGLAQNYLQAIELYRSAAQQNYLPAQEELARQYENGIVRYRDEEQALYWYQRAAKQGSSYAAEAAAAMIAQGRGVEKFQDGPVSYFAHLSEVLFVVGAIGSNDGQRITSAIDRFQPNIIVFHSQGGVVGEAMVVADLIHERGLSTLVPASAECLSACVYMFSAGLDRDAQGRLGVHQLQTAQDTTVVPIADIQAVISQILSAMNRYAVPPFMVERILGSSEMYYLSDTEKEQVSRGGRAVINGIDHDLLESVLQYQFMDLDKDLIPVARGRHLLEILQDDIQDDIREVFESATSASVHSHQENYEREGANVTSMVQGNTSVAIGGPDSEICELTKAEIQSIFRLNYDRKEYQNIIQNHQGCPSFVTFSRSALRLIDQGVRVLSGDDVEIANEVSEGALGLNQNQRIEIQSILKELGFYSGSEDGIFGAETRRAISDFTKYSTEVAADFLSIATWSHLRVMGRVVPNEGVWSVEISRRNPRDQADRRVIGTIQININNSEISTNRVSNGGGTRLVLNSIDLSDEGRLILDTEGFYLVGSPTRSRRIATTVSFPARQLFENVSEFKIGDFDNTYEAVLSLRRIGL
jgi:uncharacterized protein